MPETTVYRELRYDAALPAAVWTARLKAAPLGSTVSMPLTGDSMTPFLQQGDRVRLQPVKPEAYRIGDMAAFESAPRQRLVIHRILQRRGPYFLPAGDANYRTDGWIHQAALLAKVVYLERNGKPVPLGPQRLLALVLNGRRFWRWRRRIVKVLAIFQREKR